MEPGARAGAWGRAFAAAEGRGRGQPLTLTKLRSKRTQEEECFRLPLKTPRLIPHILFLIAYLSEGDVAVLTVHGWEGILGKSWGSGRGGGDNNAGIVGYYLGSLAQMESSCCPAAEPKHQRPPAETRRERSSVCVSD